MKSLFINLLLLFGLIHQAQSQAEVRDGLYFNKAGRQVWITEINGKKTSRSLLLKVSKDSVFYTQTNLKTISPEGSSLEVERIHFSQLDTLVTLKNRPGAKGAIAGGVIGFVSGIIISAVTYDPAPDIITQVLTVGGSANHFAAGLLGASAGVAVGAGIGSIAKKKWVIKGDQSNFEKYLLELDKRAYWNRSSRPRTSN